MRAMIAVSLSVSLTGCAISSNQIAGVKGDASHIMLTAAPSSAVTACVAKFLRQNSAGDFIVADTHDRSVVAYRVQSFNDKLERYQTRIDVFTDVSAVIGEKVAHCL